MVSYRISYVSMVYSLDHCTFILNFSDSITLQLNCYEWLIYVEDYEIVLADFINSRNLREGSDIVSYLEELGYPFEEKLQEFIDFKRKTNPVWFYSKLNRKIMVSYRISYVSMVYSLNHCKFILNFSDSITLKLSCYEWLFYVEDYEIALADFINSRNLREGADIVSYLEELGYPFEEKLQEFIDFKRKTNPVWFYRKLKHNDF